MHSFRTVLTWVASLSLVLGLYVGAYYATVRSSALMIFSYSKKPLDIRPQYRLPGDFAVPETVLERFFAPIHVVDRRLRPRHWVFDPTSDEDRFDLPIY